MLIWQKYSLKILAIAHARSGNAETFMELSLSEAHMVCFSDDQTIKSFSPERPGVGLQNLPVLIQQNTLYGTLSK